MGKQWKERDPITHRGIHIGPFVSGVSHRNTRYITLSSAGVGGRQDNVAFHTGPPQWCSIHGVLRPAVRRTSFPDVPARSQVTSRMCRGARAHLTESGTGAKWRCTDNSDRGHIA